MNVIIVADRGCPFSIVGASPDVAPLREGNPPPQHGGVCSSVGSAGSNGKAENSFKIAMLRWSLTPFSGKEKL